MLCYSYGTDNELRQSLSAVCRAKNMDKDSANAWGKNEDGTVNTSGPRVVVGDGNIGPQGGFVTKYVQHTVILCCFTF